MSKSEKGKWKLRYEDGEFWIQNAKDVDDDTSIDDITGFFFSKRLLIEDEEALRLFEHAAL